jgi:diguanylate cyclase (GGDEF)-like protein
VLRRLGLRAENAAILLLDAQAQELFIQTHFGRDELPRSMRIPVGTGITGIAAHLKRPVYVPDVRKDPRYVPSVSDTRSELAIPLIVRDQVIGVLDFQSSSEDYFDAQTIDLLTIFSTQASIAFENARLYSLERRRAAQLEAINRLARQATAIKELDRLLQTLCSLIRDSFAVDHVAILIHEEGSLYVRGHAGLLTPQFAVGALPQSGFAYRALTSGKPVIENDVAASPEYLPGFQETRSEICLPLFSYGDKVGVLAIESARPGTFLPGDVQPLESVADICAAAIRNAQHVEQLNKLAVLDGLTGIFNRRYFEHRILEEIERAGRYETALALVMLDIDGFKRLNDEFGHLLGDEVLRQLAGLLTQQLRKADVVCRYGGEEFAILLPEITGENAGSVADKLRRVIEAFPFPGVPRPVTISAGVARFPDNGSTRDDLVKAADEALYNAKQSGRNRISKAAAGGVFY